MLIFIENTPRAYAWGSRDALPELLGTSPTGEPQAELWLGAHPGDPATVAKAVPGARTLIDLIESDPERYGVDGGQLPFLLKVLAIGSPLSLQAHPDKAQAEIGFAAEEAAGIPREAPERNYGDPNHKPELLVALKAHVLRYTHVIDIKQIQELRGVRIREGDTLSIGALCTHHMLANDPLMRERLPGYAELSEQVANIRVRVAGTLGGVLC
ncbi:MAG: mannose-6-phosphate isomerase, class I, partial [Actinobacteria bacterium]|nr:mannose-6-phosphate isomerase, class I [Actinomycetota bacterium]